MKSISLFSGYIYLFLGIITGIAANGFLKTTEGFTKFNPTFFCVASIILGSVDTGWTFYTPYSTSTDTSVISMILGAFILGFSSILTGVNFIATVHYLRAPGMGWFKMPLFIWAIYATAIIQVLATPVLAITVVLLMFERLFGIGMALFWMIAGFVLKELIKL